VEELSQAGYIGLLDAGQVARYLGWILNSPTQTLVTFPLYAAMCTLADDEDGTEYQEKLRPVRFVSDFSPLNIWQFWFLSFRMTHV
jgi:hypothetical protein